MLSTEQKVPANFPKRENISILLLSPHPEDETSLKQILAKEACVVRRCSDLHQALSMITKGRCSLIICERNLPDGDWRDLLRQMSSEPGAPPVLVVSQHADDRLWGEVLNVGGYDVLLKPFDKSEVTRVVAMASRARFNPGIPQLAPQFA